MSRDYRLEAPGHLQYVTSCGIEGRNIFLDDQDRHNFLDRLAEVLKASQTQCYAWALVPNRFQLLLRTGPTPLSAVMRCLLTGYAVVFNMRHHREGHLFRNRYKSIVCEEDPYLLELGRHIHLDPLRSGLVENLSTLDEYPWCGHSVLMGRFRNPLIPETKELSQSEDQGQTETKPSMTLAEKTVEDLLRYFGSDLNQARQHYRAFVEEGIKSRFQVQSSRFKVSVKGGDPEPRKPSDPRIWGSPEFATSVLRKAEKVRTNKFQPKRSLEDLANEVANLLGISPELILSKSRLKKFSDARALVCYLATEETGHPGAGVARFLGITPTSVYRAAIKGKALFAKYAAFVKQINPSPSHKTDLWKSSLIPHKCPAPQTTLNIEPGTWNPGEAGPLEPGTLNSPFGSEYPEVEKILASILRNPEKFLLRN